MGTHTLNGLNRTELIQMARRAGLGNVGRLSHEELVERLDKTDEERNDALQPWRLAMEKHIDKNRKRLASQLPGCTGKCTTYGCPDMVVTRCWSGFIHDMV